MTTKEELRAVIEEALEDKDQLTYLGDFRVSFGGNQAVIVKIERAGAIKQKRN